MKKIWNNQTISLIFIAIVTILILVFSLQGDVDGMILQLRNMDIWWLFASFLLIVIYWLLRSIAFFLFIRQFQSHYTIKKSITLMMATQFFNAITPFSTGGQPFQIYMLNKEDHIHVAHATNLVVINFITYQIALVFLGVVAVVSNLIFGIFKKISLLQQLVTLGFVINVLVIVFLFLICFHKRASEKFIHWAVLWLTRMKIIKRKEAVLEQITQQIDRFYDGSKILFQKKKQFCFSVCLNIIALTAFYAIPLTLLYSTGDFHSFGIFEAIVTSAYIMMIGSFVPLPGAIGGIEYGFLHFFINFISKPVTKTIMLLWRLFTYYLGMIFGAIIFNIRERGK